MKKLLIVGPSSIHVSNFIDLIAKEFDEIIFVSSEEELDHPTITRQYKVDFKSLNPLVYRASKAHLKFVLEKEKPSVVHFHQLTRHAIFGVPLVKKMGFPVVVTAWGSDVLLVPKKNRLFKYLVQSVLQKADYATADSTELVDEMKKLGREKNNEMIVFAIDEIEAGEKKKVIYSNRLHKPLYQIDLIITLFADFVQRHKEWKLKIGAIGECTEALKQQVASAGLQESIEFVGWLEKEDNVKNYQEASIYISLPKSDGTAVSVLEAMSAGCIPIVPDLVVSKEWIIDGENGVIYKDENPLELAVKLNQEKVAQLNKEIINSRATKQVAAQQYINIYNKLLS